MRKSMYLWLKVIFYKYRFLGNFVIYIRVLFLFVMLCMGYRIGWIEYFD